MNENSSQGMFDGRFIVSLVLILACWMGWQSYMAKKYPAADIKKNTNTELATPTLDVNPRGQSGQVADSKSTNGERQVFAPEVAQESVAAHETVTSYEDENWRFQISSQGMALKKVVLKKNFLRSGEPVSFATGENQSLFGTGLLGQREHLNFNVTKTKTEEFVGVANEQGMKVTKVLHVDSKNYTVKVRVHAEGIPAVVAGFYADMSEKLNVGTSGNFLNRDPEYQEFFVFHDGQTSRVTATAESSQSEVFSQTKVAGFGTQYFGVAIVDQSPVMPEFRGATISGLSPLGVGVLNYSLLNKTGDFVLEYTGFAGPKSYELLKSIDADLSRMVDFGFFNSIGKLIFWLMRAIHATVGNWGVAIILLTILIRIAVLPFNLIGYKQMKAMTKIQPEMKLLREKYKNDPQKMNQETLALMKQAKANPLGGCLPMLLQIPVFFALYQVIGQSIELYQAPFIFWIKDLSFKDPFFVLPILMGITMYIQQKITPTAMEPAQQKVMMFLPIIFTFFMVSLPSGLTLYIFISSVFGVLQQLYFMKEKTPVTA